MLPFFRLIYILSQNSKKCKRYSRKREYRLHHLSAAAAAAVVVAVVTAAANDENQNDYPKAVIVAKTSEAHTLHLLS